MKQYRLYEDNILVITSGKYNDYVGYIADKNLGETRKKFSSWEEGIAYINKIVASVGLRYGNDYNQYEELSFVTWYKD